MNLLLDTHFVLWLVLGSQRLEAYPWLASCRPWGVSPVSLLEIQFLAEVGRVQLRNPEFVDALGEDARFIIDDAPLAGVFRNALALDWTRDPFDRLLAAHSLARRVPLCSVDESVLRHHTLLPRQLCS